jgi:DNA repair exonuclease SbcCD ATPase subunit
LKMNSLAESEIQVSEKISQITLLKDQTEKYYNQLEVLKDGFKEIKTYVFSSALSELSYRTNQFLQVLFHMPAEIKFVNEDLNIQTKIILKDQEMSLGLLSGGQFRRFSLAVDLALSDMVSSRKNSKVNLLILDEYFKDLSETSMEKCLDLLKSRKCPVLLIEHNSVFKNIVDNVFFVELQGGTSSVSRQ